MPKRRRTPSPVRRRRRAFGPIGGAVRTRGDAEEAGVLAEAWRAARGEGRALTHGFHAYPARMHPEQAGLLIERFAPAGGVVLDPFCGSGTVLVEAVARGRRAVGTDVNPLALALAHAKSRSVPAKARRALEEAAAGIARTASRTARDRDVEADAPAEARRWFVPHVLRELSALAAGVARVTPDARRLALHLVLSSILVKVSRQQAETDRRAGDRVVPAGFTARLFADRAVELGRALAHLEHAVAQARRNAHADATPPEPLVLRADARALPVAAASVDLVLTSPPYLGTYDYARTQTLRGLALGLDLRDADAREIGARSRAAAPDARQRYAAAIRDALAEARRTLRPGGACVVVVGDSIAGEATAVRGDGVVEDAARAAGLDVVAAASQDRPSLPPAPSVPRREHVVLLRASSR